MATAAVAIVGAGGLGCPAALYLAAAGVGSLTLIDDDHVSVTNLHRQVLYGPQDVGRVKVDAAADALARVAPHCRVTAVRARVTEANAHDLLAEHTVIVDATDTMPARRLIEATAYDSGLPVAWGAVQGWHGQVTVFDRDHRLADVFPGPDPLDLEMCDAGAVFGPVCGVVGTAMASEAVRLAAGAHSSLAGSLAIVDGRTGRWRHIEVAGKAHRR